MPAAANTRGPAVIGGHRESSKAPWRDVNISRDLRHGNHAKTGGAAREHRASEFSGAQPAELRSPG
jgi:hypothetical protein